MVFTSPSWVPALSRDPPDSIPIHQFMFDESYGRKPMVTSRHPFVCGLTGKSFPFELVEQRTDHASRALSKRLGMVPNQGTEWDKVVAIFSLNTIDYVPLTYSVHRLGGAVTPANAAYSSSELEHQLRSSNAKAIFTCTKLLSTAKQAAKAAGLSNDCIFLLGMTETPDDEIVTFDDLVDEGKSLPALDSLVWYQGQGKRQVAFLCYSSGTSGLPKAVMISHHNVISNILQYTTFTSVSRKQASIDSQTVLGLLPFSHIYGLIVITQANMYRGDEVIVLPKFQLKAVLEAVQKFKIQLLYLVPPVVIEMIRNPHICSQFDLTSVRYLYTGAAPLGAETVESMHKLYPQWKIGQGYGMTETCTVVFSTSETDIDQGSSGSLMPGIKVKLVDEVTALEITEHGKAGELWVQSPSVALGYLNNDKSTAETFIHDKDGRWVKSGDKVMIRLSAAGHEHAVVVDRIKDLIKVKGHQVAPAELEACVLAHDYAADCAVISVNDDRAGELPKAFVVKSSSAIESGKTDEEVALSIFKYVQDNKARYKWLEGGIEFVDIIPKSPSGKILRRVLKQQNKARAIVERPKL